MEKLCSLCFLPLFLSNTLVPCNIPTVQGIYSLICLHPYKLMNRNMTRISQQLPLYYLSSSPTDLRIHHHPFPHFLGVTVPCCSVDFVNSELLVSVQDHQNQLPPIAGSSLELYPKH